MTESKNIEVSNNYKESISFSNEENIKLSQNNSEKNDNNPGENKKNINSDSDNSEEFDNYLNLMKENKSKNIICQDLTFLLNIIVLSYKLRRSTSNVETKLIDTKTKYHIFLVENFLTIISTILIIKIITKRITANFETKSTSLRQERSNNLYLSLAFMKKTTTKKNKQNLNVCNILFITSSSFHNILNNSIISID